MIKYDVNRVLDDFQKWIFKHNYTYRQVRGFTGISESVTCNLLKRSIPLSTKNLFVICKAMDVDPSEYEINCDGVDGYESMSIDQLDRLLKRIRAVRDRKAQAKIQRLEAMLDEEED